MENATIRFGVFISVLLLMAGMESLFAKKSRTQTRPQRWLTNLGLTSLNIVVLKLLGPISAVVVADYALDNNLGLLSILPLPLFMEIVMGIVLLDLAIYVQHVCSHKIPLLWRFHKVHHADRDIDVTTGIRFHPVEALLSMVYKCLVILLFGPITIAVVLFEIILNASAMFNHANLCLPKGVDAVLRLVLVTPDSHRVHHSEISSETDSNYGFFLSVWDRVFKTYTAQPSKGHDAMVIGLSEYQHEKPALFWWSLLLPFQKQPFQKQSDKTDRI